VAPAHRLSPHELISVINQATLPNWSKTVLSKNRALNYSVLLLFFVLLAVVAYTNAINSFFLSDDFDLISGICGSGPFGVWSRTHGGYFRPFISLSLFLDYKLWGLNPTGYHFTNIFIHSLNSFCVFLIAFLLINRTQLSIKGIWGLALFSGFIFLILPSHTEAVAWISGRTDLIATFFCLSSFCTYLLYKHYSKISHLLISLLLFMSALLSKESVITYPLVILSYEFYGYIINEDNNRNPVQILYLPLTYCILLLLYLSIRYVAIGAIVGGYGVPVQHYFEFLRIFETLTYYSARTFLPYLPIEIKPILLSVKPIFFFFAGTAILFAVAVFLIKSTRRYLLRRIHGKIPKILYFLIVGFFISLVPVLPWGVSMTETEGERFIYLPSLFSSILIVLLLHSILQNKRYLVILFICLSLFFGGTLYRSNENWREAGTISKNILESIRRLGNADRLFIINLPDNLNGAFIYRNGIRDAIRLFGSADKFRDVIVVSYHNIYEKDEAVMVTRKGLDMYSVVLLNPQTYFMSAVIPIQSTFVTKNFEILDFRNNKYDLWLKDFDSRSDKLLFYSAGRVIKYLG